MTDATLLIQLLDIHVQKGFVTQDHGGYNPAFFGWQARLVNMANSVPDMVQQIFDGMYRGLQDPEGI